jgi:peptidoglycan hydrolase-like protein with peptidoglycan-binding domain
MVAAALGLVVGAGAIGWFAGAQISSPAEAAANAKPPTPSLITAAVDKRLLSADVIARGSIDYSDPVSLALSGAIGEAGSTAIVTMVPDVGAGLGEGSVALEVSGRPVILLQGELPVYRDLRPGSKGDDVLQLELALKRLGYLATADNVWGDATGAAIQSLYAALGYTANTISKSDQATLDAARDGVRLANQSLQDAIKALSESGGASGSTLLEAQGAVADTQGALSVAQSTRTATVGAANGALSVAHQDLADAMSAGTPVAGTSAFIALQTAITDATNNLAVVTTEHDNAVSAAQRQLDIAQARLKEAQSPGDTTALLRARDDASRQVADAGKQLAELEKSLGTWIPAGELIFLKNLPVQVAAASVSRGGTVSGSFMTVSGADIAMTVGLPESDAKRLKVGDKIIIDEPKLLSAPFESTISEIPEAGSSGRVQMKALLASFPPELLGANVRVIIPVESTSGEVLVVPAAALSAVANGDVRVEVEDPDQPGQTRFVTVVTGLAADGLVEVKPVDGTLAKGDRVVVGQADIGPAGSGASDASPVPSAKPSAKPASDASPPASSRG